MGMEFFATTVQGIEDIAGEEVETLLGCRATPDVGKVFFTADLDAAYHLNLGARTLHKVMIQLCRSDFEGLEDIYRAAKGIDYAWIIGGDQAFAVRSERVGVHDFTSVDVSRVVGQAIIDAYREETGRRLKVDLDAPDVEVHCLVRGGELLMGVNTTGRSLHRRGYRVYEHPAALKPTIASAMLRIGGWRGSEALIDPMCGGATIPIEAALQARGVAPNLTREDFALLNLKLFDEEKLEEARERCRDRERSDALEIHAMEKFRRHLEGGMRNAEKAGVLDTIQFKLGDATRSSHYPRGPLDLVVVNPPYGVRMTPPESLGRLYAGLLGALREAAEGAILVLITAAVRRFRGAAEKAEVSILSERRVLHGDLPARIFKCRI